MADPGSINVDEEMLAASLLSDQLNARPLTPPTSPSVSIDAEAGSLKVQPRNTTPITIDLPVVAPKEAPQTNTVRDFIEATFESVAAHLGGSEPTELLPTERCPEEATQAVLEIAEVKPRVQRRKKRLSAVVEKVLPLEPTVSPQAPLLEMGPRRYSRELLDPEKFNFTESQPLTLPVVNLITHSEMQKKAQSNAHDTSAFTEVEPHASVDVATSSAVVDPTLASPSTLQARKPPHAVIPMVQVDIVPSIPPRDPSPPPTPPRPLTEAERRALTSINGQRHLFWQAGSETEAEEARIRRKVTKKHGKRVPF